MTSRLKVLLNDNTLDSTMKKAIFLYDFTGIMAKPWLDAGYECWCFDGQHKPGIERDGLMMRVGMMFFPEHLEYQAATILDLVGGSADMVFGVPEFQNDSAKLAKLVEVVGDFCGSKWAVENPVSVLSTIWRKPDHKFHPYEYGGYLDESDTHPIYPEYIKPRDAYPKKTCIWSGGGFIMPEKNPVECEAGYSDQHRKLGGKSLKTKNIRSATPRGFAMAVFLANAHKKKVRA